MNNSDDLFGGLPAVSNAENASATSVPKVKVVVDLPTPIPTSDVEKLSEKRKGGGTSLVHSLGSAGTAMVRGGFSDCIVSYWWRDDDD